MHGILHERTPWQPESIRGAPGMPVDAKFLGMPFYGGYYSTMVTFYPNYPSAYVNFNGYPYTEIGMYAGFLTGYTPQESTRGVT